MINNVICLTFLGVEDCGCLWARRTRDEYGIIIFILRGPGPRDRAFVEIVYLRFISSSTPCAVWDGSERAAVTAYFECTQRIGHAIHRYANRKQHFIRMHQWTIRCRKDHVNTCPIRAHVSRGHHTPFCVVHNKYHQPIAA